MTNETPCAVRLNLALMDYTADRERAKAQRESAQERVDSSTAFIAKLDFLINKTLDLIEELQK